MKFISESAKWYEGGVASLKKIIWIVVIVILVLLGYYENHHLVVTQYSYHSESEQISGTYRIVQISDLHNASFGKDNRKLLEKIRELEPDAIVLTGDLVDSNHTNVARALAFAESAATICPVYYVTGNHEYWLEKQERENLFDGLQNAGVILLKNETAHINDGGVAFSIVGLDDHSLSDKTLQQLMQELPQGEVSVVLAHEPQYLQKFADTGANLVLSGHAHGGQVRLPWVGGLVAPDQGFLPKYTAGEHRENNTTMIVSRGLGNSVIPLRILNDPEIVCVDID